MPGIKELTAAQFCEILAEIAELEPADYQLGVSKMFLKARDCAEIVLRSFRGCGEIVARLRRDCGEIAARWRRDCGEIAARWRRDCGEIAARLRRDCAGSAPAALTAA